MLQFGNNRVGGGLQFVHAYRAFFARLGQAAEELFPIKRLPASVAFDDHQVRRLDGLVGGEAMPARQAFAPPSDGDAVPTDAGVNDLVLVFVALGATHGRISARLTPLHFVAQCI